MSDRDEFERAMADEAMLNWDESMQEYRSVVTQKMWQAWQAARAQQSGEGREAIKERLREALSEALGEALDCTRVWEAWGYGTMSQNDFQPVNDDPDRLEELVDAALSVLPLPADKPEGEYDPADDPLFQGPDVSIEEALGAMKDERQLNDKHLPQPEGEWVKDVVAERQRQDQKWGGPQHDDQKSPNDFVQHIEDYAGWARVMAGMGSFDKYRRRMVQVAALAGAAIEAADRAMDRAAEPDMGGEK